MRIPDDLLRNQAAACGLLFPENVSLVLAARAHLGQIMAAASREELETLCLQYNEEHSIFPRYVPAGPCWKNDLALLDQLRQTDSAAKVQAITKLKALRPGSFVQILVVTQLLLFEFEEAESTKV